MKSFKALGLDVFQVIFFRHYWNIVGGDVLALVKNAFATRKIDTRLVETLIVLNPKVD